MHPKDQFIHLLDHMDISQINLISSISGVIPRTDASGKKFEIKKNVLVSRDNFELIYFDELPCCDTLHCTPAVS